MGAEEGSEGSQSITSVGGWPTQPKYSYAGAPLKPLLLEWDSSFVSSTKKAGGAVK